MKNNAFLSIQPRPENVAALADLFIKEKSYGDFMRLLHAANETDELLQEIKPRHIRAIVSDPDKSSHNVVSLAKALQRRPDLLRLLDDSAVARTIVELLEESDWENSCDDLHGRGGVRIASAEQYVELAASIAPVKRLRALVRPKDMALIVQRLAQGMTQNTNDKHRDSRNAVSSANALGCVVETFVNDKRLSKTITPEQVRLAAEIIFRHTNEPQASSEDIFKPWHKFLAAVQNAPESWQAEVAKAVISVLHESKPNRYYNDTRYADLLKKSSLTNGMATRIAELEAEWKEEQERQNQAKLARVRYDHEKAKIYPAMTHVLWKNEELYYAPPAELAAYAAEHLFNEGQDGVNRYADMENYPEPVPSDFKGFKPFKAFVMKMQSEPEDWQKAVSDKLAQLFMKGMDDRTLPFMVDIVKNVPYLMPVEKFSDIIDEMAKQPATTYILERFAGAMRHAEYLRPIYPAVVKTLINQKIALKGEFDDNGVENVLPVVAMNLRKEIVSGFLDSENYPALVRAMSSGRVPAVLKQQVSNRDLYISSMYKRDSSDPKIREVMPERESLSLVFRKATADVMVCMMSLKESKRGGYTYGERAPLDLAGPIASGDDICKNMPTDIIPCGWHNKETRYVHTDQAVAHAFTRAAADQDAPVWVQDIVRKVMNSSPHLWR